MRIAVVGAGISGLVCAHLLQRDHDLTVFEAADWIGGHTHTVSAEQAGRQYAVDTGFIVFNHRTYPNFTRLLERWGVETQPSRMSFSVRCEKTGLEYQGYNLNTIFAQRRNLLRPSFYRMLAGIRRFNLDAKAWLKKGEETTLGAFLDAGAYPEEFTRDYLMPMGSAVWSSNPTALREFPARFFLGFFENHGFLELGERPQWYVIKGGSERYVEAVTPAFRDRIRLNTAVRQIRRDDSGVTVVTAQGEEKFDRAIVALHSPDALRVLADPTPTERELLSSFEYQPSETVLHTDERLLPRCRRAWAAWNYHLVPEATKQVVVTYNMNILQGLEAPRAFCVSLNRTEAIDPDLVLGRWDYDHPVFTPDSLRAQARHDEINGVRDTFFCGAYWEYGFHEDGVNSALRVCRHFDVGIDG